MYTFSHAHVAKPDHIATGCNELGKCRTSWWAGSFVFAYLCGPAVAFGVLNAIAWKRWTLRRWALWGSAILVTTAALCITDHLLK